MNLSNTQFRYQLVFFIYRYGYYGYIYGWLQVAFGIFCLGKTCHWHLLPRQKLPSASFDWRHVLPFTVYHNFEEIRVLANSAQDNKCGQQIWNFNYHEDDIKENYRANFWRDVFIGWSKYRYHNPQNVMQIKDMYLYVSQ